MSRFLLERLIGFPTVSRNSNLELIDFVRNHLDASGVQSELFPDAEGRKASLWATIGPPDVAGVVLSGHTDVVPVDGQSWTADPFVLTERDGRLYGRGTADMKGFIACVLAQVPRWAASPLRLPVHIALSYDEEVGCVGVRPMLAELSQRLPLPRLCLIGEPSQMRPVLGHKGKLAMRCHVRGAACHSAYAPSGVNAIEYAAQLISRLTELGHQWTRSEQRDARFDPPFSTLQTGLIRGGTALNIVPAECEFDFEMRTVPGVSADAIVSDLQTFASTELEPRMRAVSAAAGIEFTRLNSYPALSTAPDSDAARLLALLSDSSSFCTVAYGSEGGLFNTAGIPSVICGPGSMDQGHKPDEFLTIEQLQACEAMLARLTAKLTQTTPC